MKCKRYGIDKECEVGLNLIFERKNTDLSLIIKLEESGIPGGSDMYYEYDMWFLREPTMGNQRDIEMFNQIIGESVIDPNDVNEIGLIVLGRVTIENPEAEIDDLTYTVRLWTVQGIEGFFWGMMEEWKDRFRPKSWPVSEKS